MQTYTNKAQSKWKMFLEANTFWRFRVIDSIKDKTLKPVNDAKIADLLGWQIEFMEIEGYSLLDAIYKITCNYDLEIKNAVQDAWKSCMKLLNKDLIDVKLTDS